MAKRTTRMAVLWTLALASPALAGPLEQQIEVILNDPDARAKDRAVEALVKIGKPALAPLLAKVIEMSDRLNRPKRWSNPDELAVALAKVAAAAGPEAKRFVVEAWLDEKDERGRTPLWGAVDRPLAVRIAFERAAKGKPMPDEVVKQFDRYVTDLALDAGARKDLATVGALFDTHAAVVNKHPKLKEARASLQIATAPPAKGKTFLLSTDQVTTISLSVLDDFYVQIPPGRKDSMWDFEVGEVEKNPMLKTLGGGRPQTVLRDLGIVYSKTSVQIRFVAMEAAETPMRVFEAAPLGLDAGAVYRVQLRVKALTPEAQAKREAELRESPDRALRYVVPRKRP